MFFENFLLNFFSSFIFLVLIFLSSLQIKYFFKKKNIILNYFEIFAFLISLYFIIISFGNFFHLGNIQIVLILLFLLTKIFFLIFFKKKYFFGIIEFFKSQKKFNFILFLFFLISILPLSDADSIASHMYVAKNLFQSGHLNFSESLNIEGMLYFGNEAILQISYFLKSDNFGSQLNFISLVVFLASYHKKNSDFRILIFSAPLIIFLISTQKLQLFYGLIFLHLFICLKENSFEKNLNILIFLSLLFFYSSGKLNYVLFSFIIYLYLCIKRFKKIKIIILQSIFCFALFSLPIVMLKYEVLSNPIAPFYDKFFLDRENFKAFEFSLRSNAGWYEQIDLKSLLSPFIPLSAGYLSSGFGLVFLYLILNFKSDKFILFFSYLIIILIIINGQLIPRYYLEAFLILAFYTKQNKCINSLCNFQIFFVLLGSFVFVIFAYFLLLSNNFSKENYQKRFAYSYFNSLELNKLNYNVLGYSLDRSSIFFNNNIYSMRLVNSLNSLNLNYEKNLLNFLKNYNIKYFIYPKHNPPKVLRCIKTKKIKNIDFLIAKRNFFIDPKKSPQVVSEVIKIKFDKCN